MSNLLTKEIISPRAPAWVGLQHFLLTAFVLYALLTVTLAIFGLFWAYGRSELLVEIILAKQALIAVAIASLLHKKRMRSVKEPKKVFYWSTFYATCIVLPFALLFSIDTGTPVYTVFFTLVFLFLYYYIIKLVVEKF